MPTLSGTPTGQFLTGVTSNTFSFTMPATGENRAVVVNVGAFDSAANSIASVTYGGVAMTKVGATQGVMTDNGVVEQYILVDPPTGANNVVITMSGSAADELFGSASGWVDVDQSTPAINSNNGSNDGVTNPSLSVTVDGLDVGIAFLLYFANNSATCTESDTLLHEREAVGTSSGYSAQYGDGTFGWTLSLASDNDYIGFSLVEAADPDPLIYFGTGNNAERLLGVRF